MHTQDDGFAKMHRFIEKQPMQYKIVDPQGNFFAGEKTAEFNILVIERLGMDLMNLYTDMKVKLSIVIWQFSNLN